MLFGTVQVYKAPEKLAAVPPQGTLTRRREDYVSDGPWKPKKYAALNQVTYYVTAVFLFVIMLVKLGIFCLSQF